MKHYVACDLGAESGRVILGTLFSEGILELREIHRFTNGPLDLFGSLRWDILGIFKELKTGLAKLAAEKILVKSLSVDSWGVDYVWFNRCEPLLALPYHYRDARTDSAYSQFLGKVGRKLVFEETGIQFMQLNTLYQFAADVAADSPALARAESFLNIGDYLNYLFSGVPVAEISLASTTQIYNPRSGGWSKTLAAELGIPLRLFPEVRPSASVLGGLLPAIANETGLTGTSVVATCSHDTGAAVAAVPAEGGNWAYLSSGTWSLMGVELDQPLINEQVLSCNYTNEIGAENSIRFLKNIVGLWLLQETRRQWAKEGVEYDYAALTKMAEEADPFLTFLDPSDPPFLKPGEMPAKIAEFARRSGQAIPGSHAQVVRTICESLALSYRKTLEEIESLTGKRIERIHVVGGGSKNKLLNQMTADATGRTVVAGPVEATAIGNLLLQAMALGDLADRTALRRIVANSFEMEVFEPSGDSRWVDAYRRFREVCK